MSIRDEMYARLQQEYDRVLAQLETVGDDRDKVRALFARALELAEQGYLEAAALLGELQALEPAVRDAAAAYRWYYIDAARSGSLSVELQNRSDDAQHYLGLPGDFRNEPIVADLIEMFGVSRIPELDREARAWLERHNRLLPG